MDDLTREKRNGFDFEYLMDVPAQKEALGETLQTPGFGLAAQLFAATARAVIERLGPEKGEALLKEAVEYFGEQRGRRIAERVRARGLPLTFKNWLIHSDIDSTRNFHPEPEVTDGDLVVRVGRCTFFDAAREWGLEDYAGVYCRYVDFAILRGYNPDVKLVLQDRMATGTDHCIFRYIMKEGNR
ncbi:MAG: L-2-amino-thiazoline-4-carboxylic acid hydrolase [Proteobacteria bacterium]|nr:L-2-amino-thiazoline-4-carboxylic acid hydrolase [Pseudomonadota bacterium]